MHYIKLLRPPTVELVNSRPTVRLVLAITTDLYDSYLSPPNPIPLSIVALPASKQNGVAQPQPLAPIDLTPPVTPQWKSGMRVMKLDLTLPPRQAIKTLQIRPKDRALAALSTADICAAAANVATASAQAAGLIVPVYVDLPEHQHSVRGSGSGSESAVPQQHVSFRSLRLLTGAPLQIEEELGESMARHVWDGGVAAVAVFAELCDAGSGGGGGERDQALQLQMPVTHDILRHRRPLNVLELGCGVGTFGVGLAHILSTWPGATHPVSGDSATEQEPLSDNGVSVSVMLTDLPDAEARARENISRFQSRPNADPTTDPTVGFESLDWDRGKDGEFGEEVTARAWDLVVVSDCTYNTDTLPMLVKTLSALHRRSAEVAAKGEGKSQRGAFGGTSVVLGTKPRHESESAVFGLLAGDGWIAVEKTKLPLPHLGAEGQVFELYLLQKP